MERLNLLITEKSKNLADDLDMHIYDLSANGIEVTPKDDDFPMPWDAGVYIEDGMFIIDGDLGQQGSHNAYAKVGIPVGKVQRYLDIAITANSEEDLAELKEIFSSHGWL